MTKKQNIITKSYGIIRKKIPYFAKYFLNNNAINTGQRLSHSIQRRRI